MIKKYIISMHYIIDKIYHCVILTLRNFVMGVATNGSRVYNHWLVFN